VIVGGMSVSAVFTLLLLPSILRLGEARIATNTDRAMPGEQLLAQTRTTS
jgi:hypothetical protein